MTAEKLLNSYCYECTKWTKLFYAENYKYLDWVNLRALYLYIYIYMCIDHMDDLRVAKVG